MRLDEISVLLSAMGVLLALETSVANVLAAVVAFLAARCLPR